jgi:hypothetical protein
MRIPRPLLVLLLASIGGATAVAADPISDFKQAMSSDDSTVKRAAVMALASGGKDEEIYPLLIQAVSDRQAGEAAIAALRARSGLAPAQWPRKSAGYPGYPVSDSPGDWGQWLAARTKEKGRDKEMEEQKKKLQELEAAAKKKEQEEKEAKEGKKPDENPEAKPGETSPDHPAPASKVWVPPNDLGPLDRIVFKTGGSLLCYILSERKDADGNVLSYRIVHQDDGGEEILTADLIARVEKDVKPEVKP